MQLLEAFLHKKPGRQNIGFNITSSPKAPYKVAVLGAAIFIESSVCALDGDGDVY